MDAYTPQRVAAVLRGDTDDPNERIDVQMAVAKLPPTEMQLLLRYAEGLSRRGRARDSPSHLREHTCEPCVWPQIS